MQWQKSVGKRRLLRQPAASHRSSHWKWSFIRPFLSFPSPLTRWSKRRGGGGGRAFTCPRGRKGRGRDKIRSKKKKRFPQANGAGGGRGDGSKAPRPSATASAGLGLKASRNRTELLLVYVCVCVQTEGSVHPIDRKKPYRDMDLLDGRTRGRGGSPPTRMNRGRIGREEQCQQNKIEIGLRGKWAVMCAAMPTYIPLHAPCNPPSSPCLRRTQATNNNHRNPNPALERASSSPPPPPFTPPQIVYPLCRLSYTRPQAKRGSHPKK